MNLLLVSIDSLRLDYTGRTGSRVHAPAFDALTRHFGFCERCFSVSSATRPVHTSLLTGLYPFEHGVLGQDSASMRRDIPHLFSLLRDRGYAVGAFSEAREIFTGLDYAPFIEALPADGGPARAFVEEHSRQPRCLFLHYWHAHTPYGAADGRAWGETWDLLRQGRTDEVRRRYARAVEEICERRLAPLLRRLDPDHWCTVLFSDHGESWTAVEPYHGLTLRNSVLRVPLYYHLPGTGNPALPRPIVSLVDLFPTLVALFALETDYTGPGRDLRQEQGPEHYLAQIHPAAHPGDLRPGPGELPLIGRTEPGRQWALFDARRKFTWDEDRQTGRLETTFGEEPVEEEGAADLYRERFARMQARSVHAGKPLEEAPKGVQEKLEKRLRDLGYLG